MLSAPAFKIGLWNAWIFMSVFILQMLAIFLIDKRVWERSHVAAEGRKNKKERYVAVLGNGIWLIAMIYSVFLPLQRGTVLFYTGLSVFVFGLVFITIATINFITTPADRVITRGCYRVSRHPMYVATFFICTGSGIAAGSWFFIVLSIVMAICFYEEALIEERHCRNMYGNAYQEYIQRNPRWIGFPKRGITGK